MVGAGDTPFHTSIGRTDFQFGSYPDIVASLRKVVSLLPPDTVVLPGHGEKTEIGFEKMHNPFIN